MISSRYPRVADVRKQFVELFRSRRTTNDRTGSKTLEIGGASFLADEDTIFGEVNRPYVKAEIDWYASRSTNVNDLRTESGEVPAAWVRTATKYGEINSNYGHLIHSNLYFDQYSNVLHELIRNPDSRRAVMVYNRPSVWVEFDAGGKSDFICTNAVAYYLRDETTQYDHSPVLRLHAVVQMRSNDAWAGYRNDYAWQRHVLERLVEDYNRASDKDATVHAGEILWQVMNLHAYEKDWWRIDAYDRTGDHKMTKAQYEQLGPTP